MKNVIDMYSRKINRAERTLPIQQLNSKGIKQLNFSEWPSFKEETWRYTNLNYLKQLSFSWLPIPPKELCLNYINSLPQHNGENSVYLFDGHYLPGLSDRYLNSKEGFQIITTAQSTFGDMLDVFNDVAIGPPDLLRSMNAAFANHVFILKLKDSQQRQKISIENIEIQKSDAGNFSTPRILLYAEESAKADCEFVFKSLETDFVNIVFDIYLKSNAEINISQIMKPTNSKAINCSQRIQLEEGSQLHSSSLIFGSQLSRLDQQVFSEGIHSKTHISCAYIADGKEQVDIISTVNHHVPKCESTQWIKGIVDGAGRANINGRIYIQQGAQEVDSQLLNNNLLLSETAEVNTRPELEVEADNVKATHGATVSQLEEEEVFYLQSRGITKSAAVELLLRGYLSDIFKAANVLNPTKILEFIEDYFDKKYCE